MFKETEQGDIDLFDIKVCPSSSFEVMFQFVLLFSVFLYNCFSLILK